MGFMTVKEMWDQYPSEWIFIENPEQAKTLEVRSGNVLYHSRDRSEFYRKVLELKPPPRHSAVIYTGTIPKNTVVVL